MMNFLTSQEKRIMDVIKLDYVYNEPHIFGERSLSHSFLTYDNAHCDLLSKMMHSGQIPDDYEIAKLLQDKATFDACNLFTSYGDMVCQIDRDHLQLFDASILYCPSVFSDEQKIRLRLWHEYFRTMKCSYQISWNQGNDFLESDSEIQSFLMEQQILDDENMSSLIRRKSYDS